MYNLINTSGHHLNSSRGTRPEGVEKDPESIRPRRLHRVRRTEPGCPGRSHFRWCWEKDDFERHHPPPDSQEDVQGGADILLTGIQFHCDGAATALRDRSHGRLPAQDYHSDVVSRGDMVISSSALIYALPFAVRKTSSWLVLSTGTSWAKQMPRSESKVKCHWARSVICPILWSITRAASKTPKRRPRRFWTWWWRATTTGVCEGFSLALPPWWYQQWRGLWTIGIRQQVLTNDISSSRCVILELIS